MNMFSEVMPTQVISELAPSFATAMSWRNYMPICHA